MARGSYPCPRCRRPIPTRAAPSGAVRITRHDNQAGRSCPGTGYVVLEGTPT
jgi:hypothetical protein